MVLELPPIYNFPPLFTPQPNVLIRKQQLDTWTELIVQYCQNNKLWLMSHDGQLKLSDKKQSLFNNQHINRSVNSLFIDEIWSVMLKNNKAIKYDETKYFILWKSLESWASLILEWCEIHGKLNQVITIYELIEGDESHTWEFYGMNEVFCEIVLNNLVERGRASILKDKDRVMGVKIV